MFLTFLGEVIGMNSSPQTRFLPLWVRAGFLDAPCSSPDSGTRRQCRRYFRSKINGANSRPHSEGVWRKSASVNPSNLAVFRLMANSNFVGCITGRSDGFSPLSMRPIEARLLVRLTLTTAVADKLAGRHVVGSVVHCGQPVPPAS